ncbi:hypothetical protein MRS44_000399 [Fusarium solani]|uniref:uncharacterized protein n=1 Tax=Fusarium solani TaxID=169388 RepID=UPI0032C4B1CE|nr:hypothetical protein MRS44_000399 [Fusarium solani]
MDAGGGPHTYVGAVSPSASATVSYLWAWDAKTAGKWMPRAAQIKSRHYKYESEQLAGRSLWSCGGQDEGSELGVRVADLRSRHGQYQRPQPHSRAAWTSQFPIPDDSKNLPPCEGRGRCRRTSTVQVRGSHLIKADLGGHPQRPARPTSPDRNDPTSPEVQLECHSKS